MKKSILILTLFLFGAMAYSQSYIREKNKALAVVVEQDLNLAIRKDDSGNTPFTRDVKIKMEWRMYSTKTGYVSIIPYFENADLFGGDYMGFGVNVGYTFDEWIEIPENRLIGQHDIDVSPYFGLGDIKRKFTDTYSELWESSGVSVNIGVEINIKIWDDFGLVLDLCYNSRTDLKSKYPEFNEVLSKNFAVGFKYEFH